MGGTTVAPEGETAAAAAVAPGWCARHGAPVLRALALAAAYLLAGGLIYGNLEPGWTAVDAVYFSMATMSTVGYGDLSPTMTGTRLLTVGMIFVGIIAVFGSCASAIGSLTERVTATGRARLERAFPMVSVDLDGDGESDYRIPASTFRFYAKNLLPSLLLNVSLQLVSAGVFIALESEWSFGDAVYHCVVTATTVGYGDVKIATQNGKMCKGTCKPPQFFPAREISDRLLVVMC